MNFIEDNRVQAREWAKEVLQDATTVILDTETTGLDGEAVEIAIIDLAGNTLFNRRVKPVGIMEPRAEQIHGISLKMLEHEPTFDQVYSEIAAVITGRRVLIYNYAFDSRILAAQCKHYGLKSVKQLWRGNSDCVMEWYAQFVGDWSDYHGSYRWQRLPSGNHSALGDCMATLGVLKEMAGIVDDGTP